MVRRQSDDPAAPGRRSRRDRPVAPEFIRAREAFVHAVEQDGLLNHTTEQATRALRTEATLTRHESLTGLRDKLKSDLDGPSELGEMESLRLQMSMARPSKMMATLSNLLQKVSATQESIVKNLKWRNGAPRPAGRLGAPARRSACQPGTV